jgi:hypothetical protein
MVHLQPKVQTYFIFLSFYKNGVADSRSSSRYGLPFHHLTTWSVISHACQYDVIDHQGSADRNYSPISEALRPWINESIASSSSSSLSKRASSDNSESEIGTARAKILEIGSYPYAHIRRFASEFAEVEWYGSGRDEWEVK